MADRPNIDDDAFEDIDMVVNFDPEDLANIDDVFDVDMNVNFEDLMNEESDEESSDEERALSDDSGHNSYQSDEDDYTDDYIKIVPRAEILALNNNTRHCKIEFYYYSTSDALVMCAKCMVRLADTEIGAPQANMEHTIAPIEAIEGQSCSECLDPTYTIFPSHMCPYCTHLKNNFL